MKKAVIRKQSKTLVPEAKHRLRAEVRLKEILASAEERDRQNQLILAAVTEGILSLDLAGNHVFANPAAAKMLGYAPEELMGRGGHGIWHHSKAAGKAYPEDECPICTTIRAGVECQVADEVFWRKDGTCLPVDYRCTPIQKDGRRTGVVVTFADVARRREERKVQWENKARMAAALDIAGLGFYEVINNVRVAFLDPRVRDIIGASPADEQADRILGFWLEHLHPEDRPSVMEARRVMDEGGRDRMTLDYRFLNPARGTIHIHHLAHVVDRDASGLAVRTIGVLQDVTEQKQREDALRESEKRLRQAAESAGFGIYRYDLVADQAFYSPEFLALYGLPAGAPLELDANRVPARVHPDDKALFLACMKRSVDPHGAGVFEVEFRVFSGNAPMRWLRAHGQTFFDGLGDARRPAYASGILQDITLRKQTDEALRRNEVRLASAIDIANLGFYEQSHEERTTFIDCRAQNIVGFYGEQDDENAVFQFWAKHLSPEDSSRILNFHRELDEGAVDRVTADYRYLHPQRGVIWIHHLVHVVERRAGKRVRTIGVLKDITERKEAELAMARGRAEVTHLSRVAMLGELSGALAHELNQPLTAILSNAQAAQRFLADDQPDLNDLRDILNDIVHDDQRAGEVIRRLRSLLKKGEVSHQSLNLNEIVGDVLRLAHNDLLIRNITTRTKFAHGVAAAKGDRVQLQQVLLNLIMNAADAMATCAPPDRQLFVGTDAAGPECVRVSVIDLGHGIAPDVMSRLFDPFVTTKAHGLGLGLKVCRTIIESHGGQITGANNSGRGATFTFTLPAEAVRAEEGAGHGE